MTINRLLRMVAGVLILISLLLSQFHNPWWLLFTAFIGLNLLQSAYTNSCPMMSLFKKLGFPEN